MPEDKDYKKLTKRFSRKAFLKEKAMDADSIFA